MITLMCRTLVRQVIHGKYALQFTPKQQANYAQRVAVALRPIKNKSERKEAQYFSDSKQVRVYGGKGGDGCISFMRLWSNERAGPDGGDGGNGGHVIFEASNDVRNFNHVTSILKADEGEKGNNRDCHGRNASHTVVKVPIGTIVKNGKGKVVGDLFEEKMMFVAGRGGSGGKGNHFFTTATEQAPDICEYGANGEELSYFIELRSMADVGFIGFPNAGKSTLLRAISRAKPKVAPYPFTTLRPHIGVIQYDDYEQVSIADLPGLIPNSHKNKGLGIQFLKHAERCCVLLFVLDVSYKESFEHYKSLLNELYQFSPELSKRRKIIAANKIDLPEAQVNADELEKQLNDVPVIRISAKIGTNISQLLEQIRIYHDENKQKSLNINKSENNY